MKTIVTRVGFCPLCFDAERPKTDNFYAVKGSSGWHVHIIEYATASTNQRGFVPFIFELNRVSNGEIHFTRICSMHSCGLTISYDEEKDPQYGIHFKRKENGIMTIKNWNSLITFKDTGYRLE